MKAKYLVIYILAGAAFLGVSLWVFLSNGKSSKAIRYKYKLGGILLTAWSMLTFASCEGGRPVVTCYEPAVTCYDVVQEQDLVVVGIKDKSGDLLKCGDAIVIKVEYPSYERYRYRLSTASTSPNAPAPVVLQENDFEVKGAPCAFEMLVRDTDYTGTIKLVVYGLYNSESEKEAEAELAVFTSFHLTK
ncbi:MAG: hypothetical protein IKZ51_05230 [Bacteroidales bacterium]|nr:hypothetical protein [Bacteroidales bacterium]